MTDVASLCLNTFRAHSKPCSASWTVLAGVVLELPDNSMHCIVLATGIKCSSASKLTLSRDRFALVHDMHAEVLARRGLVRWLLDAIRVIQCNQERNPSCVIDRDFAQRILENKDGKWCLKQDIQFHFYCSHPPCGAASMPKEDKEWEPTFVAKRPRPASAHPEWLPLNGPIVRGRYNYLNREALRTKPARGDAPCTRSLSCSDKLCLWQTIGLQSACLSSLLSSPIRFTSITVGNVTDWDTLEQGLLKRCSLSNTKLYSTASVFSEGLEADKKKSARSEALLCFPIAKVKQVLIQGRCRGSALPKHDSDPFPDHALSLVSRIALWKLTQSILGNTSLLSDESYQQWKREHAAAHLQHKENLFQDEKSIFYGWLRGSHINERS